jgi:hypothetical protein
MVFIVRKSVAGNAGKRGVKNAVRFFFAEQHCSRPYALGPFYKKRAALRG